MQNHELQEPHSGKLMRGLSQSRKATEAYGPCAVFCLGFRVYGLGGSCSSFARRCSPICRRLSAPASQYHDRFLQFMVTESLNCTVFSSIA